MKAGTTLATVSVIALAAGGYYYLHGDGGVALPPRMHLDGTATDNGFLIKRETVDYEAVIASALTQQASFLTMTVKMDVIRDEHIETSIKYTPLPSSSARVRVKYHVEYPIGYELGPRKFAVTGNADGLVITLHRPRLIARPSVRLLSHHILDAGILIDEEAALIELQQRIEPETERWAVQLLQQPEIVPSSEAALRGFLEPILARQADGRSPPISFQYQ